MIDALDVISITHVWDHAKLGRIQGCFSLGDIVLVIEPGEKESLFRVSVGTENGCEGCHVGNERCLSMYFAKPKSCHNYILIELKHDVAEKTT